MAAYITTKSAVAVVIVVLAITLCNVYIVKNLEKDTRALVFRFEFVVMLETMIFVGARYVWRNVNSALGSKDCGRPVVEARKPLPSVRQKDSKSVVIRGVTLVYLCVVQLSYLASIICVGEEPSFYGMASFIALGLFIQIVLCTFFLNRVLSLWTFIQRRNHAAGFSKQRKASLSVSFALVYAIIMCMYGVYFASQPPVIKEVDIPIKKLPSTMDGFRVVLVSDVHLGPTVGRSKLTRIVNMVNQLQPDIVAMVGDFVDARVSKLANAAEPIKNLKTKKGAYFVTGNHEYYPGGVDEWFEYWRSHGVNVLHNQHMKIHSDQDDADFFYLAGVDDTEAHKISYDGHGMDLDKAVEGCDADHAVVLLAHRPAVAKLALDSDYSIQLVLSGHTHGGQMFPMIIGAYLLNPFYAGLYAYQGGHVYVSQGAVYWGIPIRIGTQHELSVLTLRTAK